MLQQNFSYEESTKCISHNQQIGCNQHLFAQTLATIIDTQPHP